MTTLAVLAVLLPMILIILVAVAGVLAVWLAVFIARIVFWLAVGGVIGLALWAGQAKADPLLHHIPLFFSTVKGEYIADATIGNMHIPCIIDSGAAGILLSMQTITSLPKTSIERVVSSGSAGVANGEIVTIWNMIISTFSLSTKADEANMIVHHMPVSVIPTAMADCLIGNSFLRQFASYSIVKEKPGVFNGAVLILKDEQPIVSLSN